jgi:phospholipid transport system substrate-binding protein
MTKIGDVIMKYIGVDGSVAVSKGPRLFKPLLFLVVVVGFALAAQVNTASANEKFVSRVGKMALAVARGNDSVSQKILDLRGILQRFADMKSIALFSLGRYRRKLPRGMTLKYVDLMETFVAKFMIGFSKHFGGKQLKIIRSKKRSASDMIVETQIIYGGGASPAKVKWRVITNTGKPKIFDVQVRGVWLTMRLRSQFSTVLKENKGDFNALFAYMRRGSSASRSTD